MKTPQSLKWSYSISFITSKAFGSRSTYGKLNVVQFSQCLATSTLIGVT